jgi:CheY-like chemotaxis protein
VQVFVVASNGDKAPPRVQCVPRVVWAEDAASDQMLISHALKSAVDAPKVHFVDDGAQAVEAAARIHPELVVLDVNMPGMDGFQVLDSLRHDPSYDGVAIVMFSTSDRAEDIARSAELGATAYVQKPMALNAFTQAVHDILERARTSR